VGHDQELAEDMGFLAVYPYRDRQFPVSIQMQKKILSIRASMNKGLTPALKTATQTLLST